MCRRRTTKRPHALTFTQFFFFFFCLSLSFSRTRLIHSTYLLVCFSFIIIRVYILLIDMCWTSIFPSGKKSTKIRIIIQKNFNFIFAWLTNLFSSMILLINCHALSTDTNNLCKFFSKNERNVVWCFFFPLLDINRLMQKAENLCVLVNLSFLFFSSLILSSR